MRKSLEAFKTFHHEPDRLFIWAGVEGGIDSAASTHLDIRHAPAGLHRLGRSPEHAGKIASAIDGPDGSRIRLER